MFSLDEDSNEDAWLERPEGEEEEDPDEDEEVDYDYTFFDDDLDEPGLGTSPDEPDGPPHRGSSPTTGPDAPRSHPAPTNEFYLDLGGYHPYLLLAKKPANVTQLIAHLRASNFSPSIAGISRRPASNGRQYAFYVRIGNKQGGFASMTPALEPLGIVPEGSLTSTQVADRASPFSGDVSSPDKALKTLAKQLQTAEAERDEAWRDLTRLRSHVADLEQEVASARADLASTQSLLAATRSASAEQAKHREELIARQREQATSDEELRAAVATSTAEAAALRARVQQLHDEIEALRRQLESKKAELEGSWNDQCELDEKYRGVTRERDSLRSQLDDKQRDYANQQARAEQLQHALDQQKLSRHRSDRRQEELDRFLAIQELCPDLSLQRESETIVERECEKFQPLFEKLFELQQHRQIQRSKRVQSTSKWMEIHFSTGSDDDGRLYYRAADQSFLVLVSRKHDQRGDIKWMQCN